MSTSTPPRREHVEIDRDRVLDDELDVVLDVDAGHTPLPEHLDRPIEVPESDALEQELVAGLDDDERR
jgi:hypothetical protein